MRRIALLVFAACGGHAVPSAPPRPVVRGTVTIASSVDAKVPRAGTLLVYWMTKADYDDVMSGGPDLTPLVHLFEHLVVVGPVDLSQHPAEYVLPVDPGEVVVSAFLDSSHDGMGGMIGATAAPGLGDVSGDGKPVTVTGDATSDIAMAQVNAPHAHPETCSGPNHQLVTLDAPEVAGAMGNDTHRRVCVVLPDGYAEHPDRRYPVEYEFPGWGADDAHVISFFEHDQLFAAAAPDTILAIVDTSTKSGSSYLTDSPRTGAWDSYVADQVIPAIDARFRTIATREGRATVGHSTGGFDAISWAMRHPDLIGVIAAGAPDGADITAWALGRPWSLPLLRVERATGGAGILASYGNDWSPDDSAIGWASPIDPETGAPIPEVMAKWDAQSPSKWLDDPARAAQLVKEFGGKLCLTVGKTDEFELYTFAQAFDQKLTQIGLAHDFILVEHGHFDPDVMSAAFRCAAEKLKS